ncbi:unnamed protein product [Pseudo-nitzschia multistriata]|uniref:Battenin n=1 Tax=Pseudo-nitzschia multistriata TaxID=183589 RepID=A0A448Z0W3_9STRA|nr:unnamed protein product [Pseudo-nitzschia multistriata]
MQRNIPRYEPVSLELPPSTPSDGIGDHFHGHDGNCTERSDWSHGSVETNYSIHNQQRRRGIAVRLRASFWLMGLLNNAGYTIMIAAAKNISEGGVALVFLANILPALGIKATAPYWFEKVSYERRLFASTASMVASFSLVASSSTLQWQLVGVAFSSLQSGLGEASLLALAGRIDGAATDSACDGDGRVNDCDGDGFVDEQNDDNSGREQDGAAEKGVCLNGFSSGTGFAGVFGFFWKWFWNNRLGLSLSNTLWLAIILPVAYLSTYRYVEYLQKEQWAMKMATGTGLIKRRLQKQESLDLSQQRRIETEQGYRDRIDDKESMGGGNKTSPDSDRFDSKTDLVDGDSDSSPYGTGDDSYGESDDGDLGHSGFNALDSDGNESSRQPTSKLHVSAMDARQRFCLVLGLWPYMVPLFTVYVAEYTLQSGTWTTIGFPVTSVESRDTFFEYSNWMYQAGVFVSRSSGSFFLAPMVLLWMMPFLQVLNVGIYWFIAAHQQDHYSEDGDDSSFAFVYSPVFLYPTAFYTGLLGGAVYIHGYLRICRDLPLERREFALSATSLAECLGIVVADGLGLLVQACLYRINGLDGAVTSCPVRV